MEIIKNKASGKYFIYIEEEANGKALFVTPNGEVKSLELNLFFELEENDENHLLTRNMITQEQAKGYHKFVEEIPADILFREMDLETDVWEVLLQVEKKLSRRQWQHLIDDLEQTKKNIDS